jgi:inorganic pyrophosphatase
MCSRTVFIVQSAHSRLRRRADPFPTARIAAELALPVVSTNRVGREGPDEKILCVPFRDPVWSHVKELQDLLPSLRNEIEHFVAVYKGPRG